MKLKTLFVAASLFCSVALFAQEPAATVDTKNVPEAAELLDMAGRLVHYGYQTKTAMPLIQAAEIYNRVGVAAETEAKVKESQSDAVVAAEAAAKQDVVSYEPAQLLADATKFADGDANLLALIKAAGEVRGATNGPIRHTDSVNANHTDRYTISFRGGEEAIVIVNGDGDTDLDLFIYDENGNFITSDTDSTDNCVCTFNPRWTGPFTIKIKNYGNVYNRYVLITN